LVVGWAASCAGATAGWSRSAAAAKTVFKRKFALIAPALSRDSPLTSARRRRRNARRTPLIQALDG
jgi:hypothetical protein